ncbi:MAG: hypothetical protein DRP29_09420 [Thermodesulfobacteriota bacterium]|nr:MAG: hypothetical protein DRP29_09420 [Thermodesulfobacteriota bacterium]
MSKEDLLLLKELEKRFHTLPLDLDWLKKRFGEKRGEEIFKVLNRAVKEKLINKVPSIDKEIVSLEIKK